MALVESSLIQTNHTIVNYINTQSISRQNFTLGPHCCHRPLVPANSELQRSPCIMARQPKLQPQQGVQSHGTAVTTRLAMNIQTRARVFQDPFQSRKDSKIIFARSIVRNAPINVLDVRRTRSHGQSIVGLCVARRWVYRAHTIQHMRHTTPTQPLHVKSRTQTTPEQRSREKARQASFRWKHLTVTAFVRV